MTRRPSRAWLTLVVFTAVLSTAWCTSQESLRADATCVGATPCKACRNCSSCKHCKKDGGTCGVCRKTST